MGKAKTPLDLQAIIAAKTNLVVSCMLIKGRGC
jgi:hypothetical protein